MENIEKSLDWNETIEKEAEYILLPAGEYEFKVESFERGRHPGSEKLPPCNKATLKITVFGKEGKNTIVNHNLFLHTKTEGMLSAFFSAIGLKKKGESIQMNWNLVPGSYGKCKLGIKEYNNNQYNEIKTFLPREEKTQTVQFSEGNF